MGNVSIQDAMKLNELGYLSDQELSAYLALKSNMIKSEIALQNNLDNAMNYDDCAIKPDVELYDSEHTSINMHKF